MLVLKVILIALLIWMLAAEGFAYWRSRRRLYLLHTVVLLFLLGVFVALPPAPTPLAEIWFRIPVFLYLANILGGMPGFVHPSDYVISRHLLFFRPPLPQSAPSQQLNVPAAPASSRPAALQTFAWFALFMVLTLIVQWYLP